MFELICAAGIIALLVQRISHNRKIHRILNENAYQKNDIME